MEREARRRRAQALDRFWDAVTEDGAAERPEDVDEVFAATIHRLADLGDLPGMDAARIRVWRNLSERDALPRFGSTAAFRTGIPDGERLTDVSGTHGERRGITSATRRVTTHRGQWVLAQVATVLLLLGTLALLYLAFTRVRPAEPLVIVPAMTNPTPAPREMLPVVGTPPAASGPAHVVWRFDDPAGAMYAISPQIAVAPDGNLWIVDGVRMGFQVVSPDGKLLERWGTPGKGEGEFDFRIDARNSLDTVSSIAFLPDGGFYVADSHNSRIQQFDRDRKFIRAWGGFGTRDGQFVRPIDVEVDADGNVYVIDAARNDVQKFDGEGQFLLHFGGRGAGEGQVNGVSWGALDAGGNLWIADSGNDRIQQFAPDGAFMRAIGTSGSGDGQFRDPRGIAFDAAGRIVVADTGNHRVQILTPDGQFLAAFDGAGAGGAQLVDPVGVAVDDREDIYVHNYGTTEFVEQFRLALPPASASPTAAPP